MTKRRPRKPGQHLLCGWCGESFEVAGTGRLPKWCSARCRHAAWSHRRAVAADRDSVEVLNQVVEVERTVIVEKVVEVPVPVPAPRREWSVLLGELADQLDTGRVYDRELPGLLSALERLIVAYNRRSSGRG